LKKSLRAAAIGAVSQLLFWSLILLPAFGQCVRCSGWFDKFVNRKNKKMEIRR